MKHNLIQILKNLNDFKETDKNKILQNAINYRLNDSITQYYRELSDAVNYLKKKDEKKIMNKINKGCD